jgi:argininosuccinate lyase
MPFRDAHHVTGAIVKMAETKGVRLDQLSLKDVQGVEPRITNDLFAYLSPAQAIASRMKKA